MLRVQPIYAEREVWSRLMQQENLLIEALEFSAPPLLNSSEEERLKYVNWYLESGRVHGVHGVFAGMDPANGDAKIREISQDRCRESCKLAMVLGAKQVVFHSHSFPVLRGSYLSAWTDCCADFYNRLTEEFPTLTLCIENSIDLDTTPLEMLMRQTNERVRICLDLGHANYSGTPLETWFGQLGDDLECLHLSDNLGRFDDHLPLGEGTVDWKKANRLYRDLGRELPLTLEVGGPDGVKKSLDFLRKNGFFVTGE